MPALRRWWQKQYLQAWQSFDGLQIVCFADQAAIESHKRLEQGAGLLLLDLTMFIGGGCCIGEDEIFPLWTVLDAWGPE